MATATLSAKELAEKLGTDGRTVRKFLRSDAKKHGTETPGKGGRYQIKAGQVKSLQKRFDAWDAARTPAEGSDGEVDETTDEA
jgi:predicted transcriptional regulator